MPAPRFRLDSDWCPTANAPNRVTLTLTNLGDEAVTGFRLAWTSLFRIKLGSFIDNGSMVEQLSNYQVVAPPPEFVLPPGESWQFSAKDLSHVLDHYSYGPKTAAVWLADGSRAEVVITPLTCRGQAGTPRIAPPPRGKRPEAAAPVSVIPFPARVEVTGKRPVPPCLSFSSGASLARLAFDSVAALAKRLFSGEALFGEGGLPVRAETSPALEDEGYALDFGPNSVVLRAGSAAGFRHGFITLGQMLRGARLHPEDFWLPATGVIADAPRFAWRGAHVDAARQFYAMSELTRFLDTMAWNKLNRFHFHLNDDEGWRLPVPAYPQLAEAAYRGPGLLVPPLLGSPFERHGGIYDEAEIAGLVGHGRELGIEIVPEIDMPGHCHCVLQALPQLRDPGETGVYRSVQYFPNNALNPAREETYAFLEAVLAQVARLFPGPHIHIGGDEVSAQAWSGSPQAQALMDEKGWTDAFQLQSHFLKRVQEIVRRLGKRTGAWEEAALGGGVDPKDSYLVVWTESGPGRALAEAGYQVVMAPAEHAYFDMAQSDEWWDPGASWAGTVTLADTYGFDPGHDWPAEAQPKLMGVQACLWSENLADRRLFDHLMFPRLSALAETGWTQRAGKDFARFLAIQSLMPVTSRTL